MRLKVSNLLIFNEDGIGGFTLGLLCMNVRKRLALCHEPRSPMYINVHLLLSELKDFELPVAETEEGEDNYGGMWSVSL